MPTSNGEKQFFFKKDDEHRLMIEVSRGILIFIKMKLKFLMVQI